MSFDTVIVGAGIAGASLAWRLAIAGQRVALLEAEERPGLHSTGRSAAMFMESYGSPQARALTRASRHFYLHPPEGFSPLPLVAPRGVLYAAWDDQRAELDGLQQTLTSTGSAVHRLDAPVISRAVSEARQRPACPLDETAPGDLAQPVGRRAGKRHRRDCLQPHAIGTVNRQIHQRTCG